MVVEEDGAKRWYLNDDLHREDGPAVEWADGDKYWYINGKLHREDGPAIEWENGDKYWYINDKLHREDGPAIEWADGSNFWYVNGKRHRADGPAEEYASGRKRWYLNDIRLIRPKEFDTMKAWFKYLNDNEDETYQLIADHNGFISFLKNPSDRQVRLHQMKHIL